MKRSHRTTILATALALLFVIPGVAAAKPVSTYEVTQSQFGALQTSSFVLTLDELGAGTLHFYASSFELIECADGSTGSITSTTSANGPVTGSEFSVDKKLSSFVWNGTVHVDSTVVTYCQSTGHLSETVSGTETFEINGSASERVRRSRVNGDRVLTSTLDTLTFETPLVTYTGAGILTETISRS